MNHAEEIGGVIFVAHHQASEVIQPGKQALDLPAALIPPEWTAVLSFGLGSIAPMRSNHLHAQLALKLPIQTVGVIGLVADQPLRGGRDKAPSQSGGNQPHLVWRSAFHVSGDRKTRSVCNCHDLGAFSTLRIADSRAPFFAGAKLPSMNVSRMSIPPRS